MQKIDYNIYFDKVYGGWYGKCLGGAAGAPVEGIKEIIDVNDFLDIMNPNLPNDDLDLQLLWLDVLEEKGQYIDSCDLADAWIEKCWYPFSEYGYFMKNYKRGICPPVSGSFNNPFFNEGMGCPIRSEIWGFVFPAQPEKAVKFAKMDGELDHTDNSVWAEMFLAAVESLVFIESDIQKLIMMALKYIPEDSKLSKCILECLDFYKKENKDWEQIRSIVIRKFGHPDFSNVVQNLGFTIIALLFGEKDIAKTINIALKCGYDADCTCATAGSIIGAIVGYNKIDKKLIHSVQDSFVVGIDVKRRSNSIRDLTEDTCKLGVSFLRQEKSDVVIDSDINCYYDWEVKEKRQEIAVNYISQPAIGFRDTAKIEIIVSNNSNENFEGSLILENIPEKWEVQSEKFYVNIGANSSCSIENVIFTTDNLKELNACNILKLKLVDSDGKIVSEKDFGIAGAMVFKAYGPFLDPMKKEPNPNHPNPHGEGCILPTVECMVNNEVYLEKEYINEKTFDFKKEYPVIINSYEDLIPIEKDFSVQGQCCFYLEEEIVVEEDKELWMVIGNNDGFKIWINGEKILEKDEIRYWTPYNNCELVKLKKGKNKIVIKLLRRTEQLKFSFGLRNYDGEHWHRKQWFTDFKVGL